MQSHTRRLSVNVYQKVSTVVALCLYLPLAWQILKGQVKQNLATWLLWGTLDAIAAVSIFVQGGNWHLPAAYVVGCTFTIICMIRARVLAWTRFETIVSIMVIACLIGWKMSGPWLATVLSTTGLVLATVPQIKDAYKAPHEMPFLIYVGYTFVNVLSTIGGKAWTVEERLYPVSAAICCVVIVMVSGRKFFQLEVEPSNP